MAGPIRTKVESNIFKGGGEKISSFLITVNSQIHENETIKERFALGHNHYMDDLLEYITDKSTGKKVEPSLIDEITDYGYSFELSPRASLFHIHYVLSIRHHTIIQIDTKKSKTFWSHVKMGNKGVHFNVTYIQEHNIQAAIGYMHKKLHNEESK